MRIPYGEWLPDLPELENPGALVAKNCIPQVSSYRNLRSLQSFTDALSSACLGSTWARDSNDVIFNFAGDRTSLYSLSGTTWSNVSQPSGYTAARWEFTQFGDRVIATNIANPVQYFDMGTSTEFAPLPGSPPNATHSDVVRDFVVLGNINDGDAKTNSVIWSGFNNSEQWAPSAATQSDSQELRGRGGPIRRIIGGDVGTIFQERSITRMSYVGPRVIFRFDEIERARGAAASGSVVWTGARAFYYANDGFYTLNLYGGEDSQPIGANRINRWFRQNAASSEIVNMEGAVDRENSLVLWAFKSSGSSPTNDRLLIYNWQANRWAYGEVEIQNFAEFADQALTLDDLDSIFPGGIDAQEFSVDSELFRGGNVGVLAFDSQNRGATFDGPILNVCLDTKEFGNDDAFSFVNWVRPLVEGTALPDGATDPIAITPITRDRLIDSAAIGTPSTINDIGICDVRVNARYQRYRLTGAFPFTHANGIELDIQRRGRR